MAALPNVRQEHFAKDVAAGMTQREAYKSNGYHAKDVDSAASRLATSPRVHARIEELKRRATNRAIRVASDRTAITKEYILEQLLDTYLAARQSGALGPANRSLELMGKEKGMFGDIQPPAPPKTLEDLPSEILEQILRESAPTDQEPPIPVQ